MRTTRTAKKRDRRLLWPDHEPQLPIGTIVLWWGPLMQIPKGWAPCDGSDSRAPNLSGRVLVGAQQNQLSNFRDAQAITVDKPSLELTAGGGAPLNQGLGDGGIHVHWQPLDEGRDFYERVKTKTQPGETQVITLAAEHLPRAEVMFIMRYQ